MSDFMSFETATLDSGLRVFFQQRPVPWFRCQLAFDVGHLYDPVGKEGTAHLLEHVLNSGTVGYPWTTVREFTDWLTDQGYAFHHGSTGLEQTWYGGAAVISSLDRFLAFLARFAFTPSFGPIERDREIVRRERAQRTTKRRQEINRKTNRAFYGDHRLATATGLPDDDVLNTIVTDDVQALHRRFYRPDNAVLIVIGGCDLDTVVRGAERSFGEFCGSYPFDSAGCPERFRIRVPSPTELVFKKDEGETTRAELLLAWHLSTSPVGKETILLRNVLNRLLFLRLREEMKVVYGAATVVEEGKNRAEFSVSTSTTPDCVEMVIGRIRETLQDVSAIRAELAMEKEKARQSLCLADLQAETCLDKCREQVLIHGAPESLAASVRAFTAVPADDVVKAAETIFGNTTSFFRIVEE